MKTYITNDNFVFQLISYKEAETTDKEVFILHEDGSQTLIETNEQLLFAKQNGLKLGIELGFKDELKQKHVNLINDFGTFNKWEGYISMYFNQKQLREIGTFLDIRFKDLKEMDMQTIKAIIS